MKFAWIAAAALMAFAGTAHAETVTATCVMTETSTITLNAAMADRVEHTLDPGPHTSRLSIDFNANIFRFGENVSHFSADAVTINAMARRGAFNGAWQLDRVTGRLHGTAFLDMRGHTVFVMVEGLCTRDDGAGAF